MSEREPITAELRELMGGVEPRVDEDGVVTAKYVTPEAWAEFARRCDAIDAVHAGLERENAELRERLAVLDNRSESMHIGSATVTITDELRKWAEGDALRAGMSLRTARDQALAIADRIDAEHESACAEAYGNGVQSVALPDMTAYVKLPVDADGVPIHIGDEMDGVDKYDSLKEVMGKVITVSFESDGIVDVAVQAWSSDGKSWHRAYLDPDASVYRHHHAPTVEDVLTKFGIDWEYEDNCEDRAALLAEYASKLRLAEGEDA